MRLHLLLLYTRRAVAAPNAFEQGHAEHVAGFADTGHTTVVTTTAGFVGAGLGADAAAAHTGGIGATESAKWIPNIIVAIRLWIIMMHHHGQCAAVNEQQ